jgi:PAS domain S-box-containing protein
LSPEPDAGALAEELRACRDRIRELESRLEESEDTLEALRTGDFDAVVVQGPDSATQVYTLETADKPFRVLIEQIQEGAVTLGGDGEVLYCNPHLATMLGVKPERLMGQRLEGYVAREDRGTFAWMLHTSAQTPARAEVSFETADGTLVPMYLSLSRLARDGASALTCGVLTDLTEQKLHLRELAEANAKLRAEGIERERIEDALRQSQKMEAVGQLTGGLAHDFNNLLTGISGSLDLLQKRVAQGRLGDLDRYLVAAQGASKRAAALTHRLLAFSRRQTLDPKPTDVTRLIGGMAELIRRTVGPQIAVEIVDMAGLWTALVDPNQLENALLNLAINARDAMPDGGRITIETANRWMDERGARERDLPSGQYLSVCVSDTGTGMAPDVVARAFDPFFTTKPLGAGTGLGLSMIYGFARQSGGAVRIYSEVGQGSTLCIYLPRHYGLEDTGDGQTVHDEVPQAEAGEVVLVVDDEPTVRMLVTDVLGDLGYGALEAEDGPSGLKILQTAARIDLLVTDVGLPGGMNGRQVADAARVLRPGLKVLFITGYAENAVVGNGHLDPGMAILTKPFGIDDLASKMRALIKE